MPLVPEMWVASPSSVPLPKGTRQRSRHSLPGCSPIPFRDLRANAEVIRFDQAYLDSLLYLHKACRRIMDFKLIVGATALATALATPAFSADIWAMHLAWGIRHTSSQRVTEAGFSELTANICNASYDRYSKAASQATSEGSDVLSVFAVNLGSANANTEYYTKWTNFCRADYSLAISNSDLKTYYTTANRAVLNSFDNCVNVTSERFVRCVEPQPVGRTFPIRFDNKRQANATFKVLRISPTDSTVMDSPAVCMAELGVPTLWGSASEARISDGRVPKNATSSRKIAGSGW